MRADDEPLAQLKSEPLVSVAPDAKEKEVFALFDKYNLRSLAVVDASGRPIGAITVDDVITRLRACCNEAADGQLSEQGCRFANELDFN